MLLRPVHAGAARQIQAGVVMDTTDMAFDSGETARRYPSIALTRLAEDYASAVPAVAR